MKKQHDLHKQKRVRMPSIERHNNTDAIRKHGKLNLTAFACLTPKYYAPFLCAGSRA